MKTYTIRGVEEVYDAFDELETEIPMQNITIKSNSLEEAISLGTKEMQRKINKKRTQQGTSSKAYFIARVDLVFEGDKNTPSYISTERRYISEQRKKEKFDLNAARRDGCLIDESGAGTCGG